MIKVDDEEWISLGKNIKRYRLRYHLTRAQLGEIIGKAESTIYSYEKGATVPSFETLCIMAEIFDVSVGRLLGVQWVKPSAMTLRRLYDIYVESLNEKE